MTTLKCYSSFKKSALTCSANFASSKTRHPTIAMPAAQLIARLYDSSDPAPAVNCGVWLTPSAGIEKMPWKPGTTYDTFPKHCQLLHFKQGSKNNIYRHTHVSGTAAKALARWHGESGLLAHCAQSGHVAVADGCVCLQVCV